MQNPGNSRGRDVTVDSGRRVEGSGITLKVAYVVTVPICQVCHVGYGQGASSFERRSGAIWKKTSELRSGYRERNIAEVE